MTPELFVFALNAVFFAAIGVVVGYWWGMEREARRAAQRCSDLLAQQHEQWRQVRAELDQLAADQRAHELELVRVPLVLRVTMDPKPSYGLVQIPESPHWRSAFAMRRRRATTQETHNG
jgi:hypothetical protein